MVRGSALRVTELTARGGLPSEVRLAVSRSAVRVQIEEVSEELSADVLREYNDQPRIRLAGNSETLGYTAGLNFLRVDPGLIHLMTGAPLALDANGTTAGF